MKKRLLLSGLVVAGGVASGQGAAQTGKALKFWNLTADTITELYAQPAGQAGWSANLCLSDPDHAVDPDERLSLRGVNDGTYNVRVVDKDGRRCLFHKIAVQAGKPYAFSIGEAQMKGCEAW